MSLATVYSRGLIGMTAPSVRVEIYLANGLPSFQIVGLADTEVRESRERVRAALQHSGFTFPQRRLTVNLAPADLPKHSGRFDLPIAVGILAASGQLAADGLEQFEFVGELSLTGEIRPVRGLLVLAMTTCAEPIQRCLVFPEGNSDEAKLVPGLKAMGTPTLKALVSHFEGQEKLTPVREGLPTTAWRGGFDMAEVKGHAAAKRAMEVAAAGGHNLLMVGPPGSGKSLLAQSFPSILPSLPEQEALAVAALASLHSGGFKREEWGRRPFRMPHHSASVRAMVGGGITPKPGEASLSHKGVLFMDELLEFNRQVLEALREPLETGGVQISRAGCCVSFPAEFQLIGATNPCPCGYWGDPVVPCRCAPEGVRRYQRRLSGPFLDRMDLFLAVSPVPCSVLLTPATQDESSALVLERVNSALQAQKARQQTSVNARLGPKETARVCAMGAGAERALQEISIARGWSSRGTHRVQKIARTLADLACQAEISAGHIAEAASYRLYLSGWGGSLSLPKTPFPNSWLRGAQDLPKCLN